VTAAETTRKYDLAATGEVPEGGRLVVEVAGVTLGVFRHRGGLYAYENVCAHQGGPACQGRMVARVRERLDEAKRSTGLAFDDEVLHIVCPWHGFEYDVTTGSHPGKPEYRLRSFDVTEEAGRIYVTV
jgi:nitrite reductase/ring-hydroxylating ferredoxin subunit